MTVRQFKVTLWPHKTTTTVTVVLVDTSGRRMVTGGVGRITLPVGVDRFHGQPVGAVLRALSEALGALASTLPPEEGSASLEGPQGGPTDQGEPPLNLT